MSGGSYVVIFLSEQISKIRKIKIPQILAYLGRNTISIFSMHLTCFYIFSYFCSSLNINYTNLIGIIIFILSVPLSIILAWPVNYILKSIKNINNKNQLLKFLVLLYLSNIMYSCQDINRKKIILIPVYGQSLALGEEADLITDFDTLRSRYNHRIRTDGLNERFGYFSNSLVKQRLKRFIYYGKVEKELSCYSMCEYTVSRWLKLNNEDSIICSFPEGQNNSGIDYLYTDSKPYKKMLNEISYTYNKAVNNNNTLVVPAFCWLQGESDIVHNTGNGYKQKLIYFRNKLEKDIKAITHQQEDVKCILYQSTCLSLSKRVFNANAYNCYQTQVPQEQMELVRDNKKFSASNPTYPYKIVKDYVHLDGISQKLIGYLEGLSLQKILNNSKSIGVTPKQLKIIDNHIEISFNVEHPPLALDTIQVKKVDNYGFSVISKSNKNILKKTILKNNKIYLYCFYPPKQCKVRYGVNGEYLKSGSIHGPRGNLRDSQGNLNKYIIKNKIYRLDNWCYIFEEII